MVIAREFFEQAFGPLGAEDRVEPAGYPEAEIRQVRLVRDGRTVAVADYADASFAGGEEGSGWISEGYSACDDASTTSAAEPPLDAPATGRVVCENSGPRLLTPVVRPQPDGVHFVVENRTDEDLYFLVLLGLQEQDVAPGETVEVAGSVAPGPAEAGCYSPEEAKPAPDDLVSLEVVDPHGLWTSPELECQGSMAWSLTIDYIPGAGEPGTPEQVVEKRVKGLRPGDEIRRARYPQEDRPVVAVVRDGRTVATIQLSPGVGGGWLVDAGEGCADEGLRL